jgi:hypothetical protein
VAQPTQLTPTEQDALVKQIGLAMLRVAPDDWEQLTVDYRAVGRYAESTGQVTFTDGSSESWEMPADLRGLFARLRGGMYREGRGTWFNARYRLDHPSSYNLEYDRDEPGWDLPPPPQAYPDDMRLFPRSDENVPEWLRRRLASAPPPPGPPPGAPDRPPGPRFRVARIFDGPGEDGRPSVNRPPVDEIEIQDVLDYLDGAPLVGPARGYDVDRLDPNGQQSVPVAFHTDGTWIWPAAVNYFLREHDISPETDLVDHIRRMRFKLPQVDEQALAAAQQFLGPPPPGPGPRPGPPSPGPTRALPVPAPAPAPAPPSPAPAPKPSTPPRAALPSQGPAAQQVDQLRARLDDLDVPETAYRIGAPTGRGWVMEQTDDGWRVGWYDRDWVAPAMFEDVADASAFLLGKLMLDTDRWAAGPKNPELPPPAPLAPEDHGFEPLSAPIDAFEPMAAPIEDYAPPAHASGHPPPAGPVMPPPGTPGYSSPPPGNRGYDAPARFSDSSGFSEPAYNEPGYSEPVGTSRHAEAPGGFTEPGFTEPGFSDPSPGYSEPSDGGFTPPGGPPPGTPPRQPAMTMDGADPLSPPRGFEPPGHGLDGPGHGLDGPGHSLDSPGRGLDGPGRGLDGPGRGLDGPGRGLDSPPRGVESPARGAEATVLAARPTNGAAAAPAGSEWPIKPLPGEPPLTLFRGKRVIELEPGTEIDRYGDDDGNLVYVAGTPFTERSLVPEWIDRPYHAYRVRQPVQALTGAAIPWFDQPGGGTAFLLPDAVGELVALGHLVEINDRERPPV